MNSLYPAEKQPDGKPVVELYEKGYGKDAAGIAMEAISHARNSRIDVVLIDTAGRMQVTINSNRINFTKNNLFYFRTTSH